MYPKVIIHNNPYEDSSTSTDLEQLSELFNMIKEKDYVYSVFYFL